MRASPAFRISIRRYGLWRAAVAALLIGTLAAQAAWLAARFDDTPVALTLLLVVMDAALLGAAAGTLRLRPVELRWDTRQWRLAPAGTQEGDAIAGRLAVALDLGVWMLLRFEADRPATRLRRTWVPVQRRGLEAQWHALRCAVYCARPDPGADAARPVGTGPEPQE